MGCRNCKASDWLYLGYSFTTFEKVNLRITGFVCKNCQNFSSKVERAKPREYIPKPRVKYEAPPKKVEHLTEEEKQIRAKQGESEILIVDDHCGDCGHKENKHTEVQCRASYCSCKKYIKPKAKPKKVMV